MSDLLAVIRKANDQESKQYLEIIFLWLAIQFLYQILSCMAEYLNFLQDASMNMKNITGGFSLIFSACRAE